jgi:hypothetical protein
MAQWLGDANVPACSVFLTVHVFYEAEAPDPTKGFQFYVEGMEFDYDGGHYGVNAQGKPETIEVEIPEWSDDLTPNGLITVYRKGVAEFAGIFLKPHRTLSDSPTITLEGSDLSFLLADTVADLKQYVAKTPQYMIADLLVTFPSGIIAGNLDSCAAVLNLPIDTENLLAAIQRVCDAVCWNFRVNFDRTLDLAEHFGGSPSGATFTEGMDILSLDRVDDYYLLKNWVRMRGDGITSTKQDMTSIMAHGLHQLPSFQSSISSQATLDTACQALLDLSKEASESLVMEAVDNYAPGTFKAEDTVTITSPKVDVAGQYTIKRIERDMSDPNWVRLELSNRLKEYWELDEAYRRMIKDVSV